jgi:iron complex outermembrane receptor protein
MLHRNASCHRWLVGTSVVLMSAAIAQTALAADPAAAPAPTATSAPPTDTSAGAEGTEVASVIVTAERGIAAKTAPVKASVDETQPESIISHDFIDQVTPEVGNISTVVFIAPSISGISGNGGGIGNYFSTTMRGFADGEYNVTYDGIAFGDTNNPTHHPNDYFPTSTIGAAVVDRGPGAAGDLGQANYGGAIHYFSPDVSNDFNVEQKFTYGSFDTEAAVTTLNTGQISQLGGGKLLVNLDERNSDTELSYSGGDAFNQLAKFVLPVGDKFVLTAFASHAWSRYNFPDSDGPGETLQQTEDYGKNFQLTDIPDEEHYYKYNFERKQTWFDYIDAKYQVTPTLSFEDEPYTYFYSNKTLSSNNNNGLIGATNSEPKPAAGTDIGGYKKRNDYTVYGDVIRLNEQLPFGIIKLGGLIESSYTYRQKAYFDLTTNTPDDEYTPAKDPGLTAPSNCKTCEFSSWIQEQGFVDFIWTPLDNLKISPGFKYVNFKRTINAEEDTLTEDVYNPATGLITSSSVVGPIHGSNTYQHPLYFLTANYKILPWYSVYAQYATSFLIPQLSELQVPGVSLQHLQPETTTNYQAGMVYTRGKVTMDGDYYLINAANTNVACNIPDAQGGYDAASCNAGKVRYSGFEGEAAYAFPFGLTLFINGSTNGARQAAQAANALAGIAGNPGQELAQVPEWTDAVGGLYAHGPWHASLTYKQVGSQYEAGGLNGVQIKIPSYDTANADVAYNYRTYQIKLQVFNLFDKRQITSYVPSGSETALFQSDGGIYTYQSGREIQLTLVGKFR